MYAWFIRSSHLRNGLSRGERNGRLFDLPDLANQTDNKKAATF